MRPLTRACGGSSRNIASDETDFPEPDSPTSPSTSPGAMEKLTSRTARTVPCAVAKSTREILDFQQPRHSVIVTGRG